MAFLDKDFLLTGGTARTLYHDYAGEMPIIDYHCHIDPREIFEDRRFNDLSEVWLSADHYKWRLMRQNGVSEKYITGASSGWEKFLAFAQTLPRLPGNPIYQWAHLDLQRYFGCDKQLDAQSAAEIWETCNKQLAHDDSLTVRGIIRRMRVATIVTTDDPVDDLIWHRKLRGDPAFNTAVLPGWRPDNALNIEKTGFLEYIAKLEEASGVPVKDFESLNAALLKRMEFFGSNGCRACDHGIQRLVYAPSDAGQADAIMQKRLRGEVVSAAEADMFRYAALVSLAKEYARLGWVMQLHLSVMRDVNSAMYNKLGPNTGYDCVDPTSGITGVASFLNELEIAGSLPKTLIFSIDPGDNAAINTLAACFTQEGVKAKVQQGPAWWFNDTFGGMEQQLKNFAEAGPLACFVGMLTDSRSFFSYTRHEYFRRILCDILGKWADAGLYPGDTENLGGIVRDVCYNNPKEYFRF